MEATFVAVTSAIGSAFSIFFFMDVIRDRWLVAHADPPRDDLRDVALDQVVEEGIYLILQVFFLTISLISILTESERLESVALLMLLAMPLILLSRSFYRYLRRKKEMRTPPNPDPISDETSDTTSDPWD